MPLEGRRGRIRTGALSIVPTHEGVVFAVSYRRSSFKAVQVGNPRRHSWALEWRPHHPTPRGINRDVGSSLSQDPLVLQFQIEQIEGPPLEKR